MGLKKYFLAGSAAGVQAIHGKRLRLILAQLDKAKTIDDMDIPTLQLHELNGSRKGIWSVTVQASLRVTSRFLDGDAEVVNYEDCH